ncbi:Uncharacterized protein SCF082_LOCUS26671, partial [Durusdinium trenchii]
MAWNKNQVAREIYLVCNAARWDPHDNEVRQMAFQLFGNPGNTKHFLEDAFSHLADVAKRFARHSKMSKWLKFFYMTCVPTQDELKWPRLDATPEDFTAAMKQSNRMTPTGKRSGKVFTLPETFKLPKALNFTIKNLKQVDRSAGTAANQRAAAATAWVLSNSQSNFRHAPMVYIMATENFFKGALPTWMMNSEITGEGRWKMLPTTLLLPSQLPVELRTYGSVWQVTGEPQPLLASAVMAGLFLTLSTLQSLHAMLKFKHPDKGQGSGKNGGIVKHDYSEALVNMLFPEATPSERKRMVDCLDGRTVSRVKCSADVINAVKELGVDGERDVHHLHQVALNQELVEKERAFHGPRAPTEERAEQRTFTPRSLKSLLPSGAGIGCSRNPLLCRYQALHSGQVAGFLTTHAATWGGPVRNLSEFEALRECIIAFIWTKEKLLRPEQAEAENQPTDEDIRAVVNSFDASTGFLNN